MDSVLVLAVALLCPVGMLAMMFFMQRRGRGGAREDEKRDQDDS